MIVLYIIGGISVFSGLIWLTNRFGILNILCDILEVICDVLSDIDIDL